MSSVLLLSSDPTTQHPRLPGFFLRSLHTLFNILDEKQQGVVHVHEIESRWGLSQGSGVNPTPEGVLDALRHMSAANGGYLTFPSLVAGLRLALFLDEQGERDNGQSQRNLAEDGEASTRPTQSSPKSRKCGDLMGKSITRSRSISGPLMPICDHHRIHREEEPRRHTLTHGINYAMLKRMKELEQEKDALLQGLEMVEKARDWYHQQLLQAQNRRHTESCTTNGDIFSECYMSHAHLLLPKIQEANQCLSRLISRSGKPDNPACHRVTENFSMSSSPVRKKNFHQQALVKLKEQNRLLQKELLKKNELIFQLEQEKVALCRQLRDPNIIPPHRHQGSVLI